LLCYRCGSHVQDGAGKCWNCGTTLAAASKKGAPTSELRARQRTGSRVFGVVFKIGDLIANRYRVSDIIGSGGAGVVYRAHDQEIDVDVAVKVINAKLVQTADEQRLFSRQTKIARKLSHQNVVRIYDEGRDEDRPFYTMQFLEGLSLRKIIDLRKEKNQTFALAEIEPIYNQLCQALDYAHKTTFHGNMKPDNVIVLPDLLKVTDFALLRGLPRKPFLAIQKSRASNFRYLAPEVRLEVNELDRQVDIYSLGVVLCEMLTGLLYDDGKPEQLTNAPGIEASVLAVIKRAVARAPKDRYLAANELYEDLRSVLAKGAGRTSGIRVPPTSGEPPHLAEMPTQRLDIHKHGNRPEAPSLTPKPKTPPPPPAAQKAVEVAAKIDLAESPDIEMREGTGSFAQIDDDMIESASPSSMQEAQARREKSGVKASAVAASAAVIPELVVDDDDEPDGDSDSETEAILEGGPVLPDEIREPSGLMEISNSAIELINDPRATNLIQVDKHRDDVAVEPRIFDRDGVEVPLNRTIEPKPLPDSALPSPVFAHVNAREPTAHGRLDMAPVAPDVVLRGAPVITNEAIPRSPTLAMEESPPPMAAKTNGHHKNGRPATKSRPATRPRMSTMPAIPEPVVLRDPQDLIPPAGLFDPTPSPEILRSPTGARPLVFDNGSFKSKPSAVPANTSQMSAFQPLAPPPANRAMLLTVIFSALAVVVAFLIVFKMQSDQQSKQIALLSQQLVDLKKESTTAATNEAAAREDIVKASANADAAAQAEKEAALVVKAAEEKRAAAEKLAKEKEDEAKKLALAAQDQADSKKKIEAEKVARAAQMKADEQRREADAEAKLEKEARAKEESERKKKEREVAAVKSAEERAEREAEKRRIAEEKRAKLEDEKLAKAEAAEEKKAIADAKKKEREEEEAAKKKAQEEQAAVTAAAAEEKKKKDELAAVEPAAATMTAAAVTGGKTCPKGMKLVDAGAYMMGAARNDPERNFGDLNYTSTEVGAFCVDYYEFPNGRDRAPTVGVSFKAAQSQCKGKQKRLCTEAEWEKACKGPSGTRFPYGNQWDPAVCSTEDDEGNDRTVAKSGEFKKCRSGFDIFDMSGNVAEWTASEYGAGAYVVKGGAADRPGYDGRCAARKKKKSGDSDPMLGFRCCADPN
jgi:serine/threonine protein kinase/formylglycine-generating enzyme required for sulfatase activity